MLNKNDTAYYDAQAFLIYDPSTSYDVVQQQIPAVPFVDHWKPLFNLNSTFTDDIHARADSCGYTDFFNTYLTFPPAGPLPTPPSGSAPGCDLWDDIYNAVSAVNPCFDIYQVATTCPLLWDVLGFPGSFDYVPAGATIYFNRTDVQRAINAPIQEWAECSNGVLDTDTSPPSGLSVLPSVIERTNGRSTIAHGNLDYILIANGTLLMIQNMTWAGAQGFQTAPSEPFFVPYHAEAGASTLAASGVMGTAHTERGLTWVEVAMSGHMIPQYQPVSDPLVFRPSSCLNRVLMSFQNSLRRTASWSSSSAVSRASASRATLRPRRATLGTAVARMRRWCRGGRWGWSGPCNRSGVGGWRNNSLC